MLAKRHNDDNDNTNDDKDKPVAGSALAAIRSKSSSSERIDTTNNNPEINETIENDPDAERARLGIYHC